jgi:AcrR family transcriptional regulator
MPYAPARARAEGARSGSRAKLMKASEELFAERGIKAVSIRDIAAAAGVNSALIAYYFGGKDELVIAVYRSVAEPINTERCRRLDALAALPRAPTLEEVLDAWIRPALVDYADSEHSRFAQLAIALASHDPIASRRLASDTFDKTNERFLGYLQTCLPNVPRRALVWRLYFLIGAVMTTARQRNWSMALLSRGACNSDDTEEMHRELVDFAAAGFRAISERPARPGRTPYAAGA